ncbi:MAG: hypothetical protein SGI77_13435 [Pirellulaceae bacterium]|nr:hypothetical protein [Pirellulaceae bacterium]
MRLEYVAAFLAYTAWLSSSLLYAETDLPTRPGQNLESSSKASISTDENGPDDAKLHNQFRRKIFPILNDSEKGCIDCHSNEGTSSLVLTGESIDDFRTLLDEQYLKLKGADTLLSRLTALHEEKRMPKDAEPWSKKDINRLKAFLHTVEDSEVERGLKADEQFPRSLLSPYRGPSPSPSEHPFISYWQLKSKIRILFDDNWVRGDRNFFEDNLAMFGGADFKTRFNESSQPSTSFLTGLEMLARDIANVAYERKTGPFRDWQTLPEHPKVGETGGYDYRDAIHQLYERVLYRPATDTELEEAYELLAKVFALEKTIQQRDDELAFELEVTDPETGLHEQKIVRIPVSGDVLNVGQFLIDQTVSESTPEKSLQKQIFAKGVRLDAKTPNQRLVVHNLGTFRNVSFAGVEILDDEGTVVETIGIDSPHIEFEGAWQISAENGFKSYEDMNQHKGSSSIRIALRPPKAGKYQLAISYRADVRNANQVLVELFASKTKNHLACPTLPTIPPLGEAHFSFDCSVDSEPFARIAGVFQFSDTGSVEIRNHKTLDTVTVGAIEFVEARDAEKSYLIDSIEADGHEKWERFNEGRFKAYNVKGVKIHDGNSKKGELALTYHPQLRTEQGFDADEFFRLRVFYPGKKEQESQVPVVVRAQKSSPIIQISSPSVAKADATLRLDASASYTVSHSRLEFSWRQISGTRVPIDDPHSPTLEVTVPRRSVEQAAWSSLCSALIRHPDFLFTRPPSLATSDQPHIQQRLKLVKLALDLVGRSPTSDEIRELDQGTSLEDFIDRFLASDEFKEFYFHRIRLHLESQGTEIQDEPVRLWNYVAFNDRPFKEILTANFTVDRDFKKQRRSANHGKTGVLTTPGFIQGKPGLPHYNYSAQVSMLFLGFVYEVPADVVEQREGVTALGTTDPNSVCYSCHKILTPLAFQRLNWNDDGEYRIENEDGLPIDASDQNASEDYPFPGKGMEAFATQAVKKERFIRTMINTHVNFYFGRPMRYREDERVLYKRLWDSAHRSNFKIPALIREIVTSPEYWSN